MTIPPNNPVSGLFINNETKHVGEQFTWFDSIIASVSVWLTETQAASEKIQIIFVNFGDLQIGGVGQSLEGILNLHFPGMVRWSSYYVAHTARANRINYLVGGSNDLAL